MAKKDNFDDVLGNKFSLMNAKSSKLLSSWMSVEESTQSTQPTQTQTPDTSPASPTAQDQDSDLKQTDFGHDRLGVGSPIPQEILNGTFTRRAPTTNDKLLEQLIGRKRARAHLAAKQEAERAGARQQSAWQGEKGREKGRKGKEKEESEDEEEGRAAIISGRARGGGKVGEVLKSGEEKQGEVGGEGEASIAGKEKGYEDEDEDDEDVDLKPKKRVKKSRAKQASYLDELLAERSKKKSGKGKGKGGE